MLLIRSNQNYDMRSTLIFVCLRWSGLWWQQRQGLYLFVAALRQPFLQPIASQWCVLISGTPTLLEQNMEHTVEHRHFYSWILAFLDKSQRTSSYFMMRLWRSVTIHFFIFSISESSIDQNKYSYLSDDDDDAVVDNDDDCLHLRDKGRRNGNR